MGQSRTVFLERISSTRSAIDHFNLRDLTPTSDHNREHNNSARIIRNGLAVQCFNILEDFLKARMGEVLDAVGSSNVNFRHLPEKLQLATTADTINAIANKGKYASNRIQFVQDYCEKIASTKGASIRLPEIAFFHSASNINAEQVKTALLAFSVKDPWKKMKDFTSRVGMMGLPAEAVFEGLAKQRHSAAHNPAASTSEIDLTQSLDDATALALGFDVLLGYAAKKISKTRIAIAPKPNYILSDQNCISLSFIRYDVARSLYHVRRENTATNIRVNADRESLGDEARQRAKREDGALLEYDSHGALANWWVCI